MEMDGHHCFEEFFEEWLRQLEENLHQLVSVHRDSTHEPEHRALVDHVMNHYTSYYGAKSEASLINVLCFFSPPWLSSLENAYLWMTGWKPSLVFRLVDSLRKYGALGFCELSEGQLQKIKEMREKTSLEEDAVEKEMESQQMAMANKKMVQLAARESRGREGESVGEVNGMVELALKDVLAGLQSVAKVADGVRLKALKGVVEVLSPLQSVDFMAAVAKLQIQMRKSGQRRDCKKLESALRDQRGGIK